MDYTRDLTFSDVLKLTTADLGGMSADALRSTIDQLDRVARALNADERGNVRHLSDAENDVFDRAIMLRDAAERHLQVRTALNRGGRSAETAFGSGPEYMAQVDPYAFRGEDVITARPMQVRDAALKLLEHDDRLRGDQLDQVDRLIRSQISEDSPNTDGSYIARRTLLTEDPLYRSAWGRLMTEARPLLTDDEIKAVRAAQRFEREYESRAMSEGVSASGGYGVPVFIDPTIVLTAQGSTNPFWKICQVATITTNAWKGVTSAGVTWSWDAEASAVSDDSPTLAQPTVPVYTARGFVPYSIEVGQDYPRLAEELARLLAEGYAELTASAFAIGTGSAQPTGVLTKLDATTTSEVLLTTAGTFDGAQVNKAWEALPDRYKSNARWVMSYNVGDQVAAFGNSNNLSFVTVDFTNVVTTLRTRPIEYSSYFPSFSGTTHANVLVVGDWSSMLIAQRAGMSVEPVQHLFDTVTGRPTGQRGAYAWARAGSDVINTNGLRLLNQT